jgi:putative ABC transport system permease protein
MLRSSPGFTAVAVLSLALGIGANTAIFSIVNTVLLRSLPYEDAERLVMVREVPLEQPDRSRGAAVANFLAWKEQSQVFEEIGAGQGWPINMTSEDNPELLRGQRVSSGFLQALAVQPVLGRLLLPEDYQADADPVIILSHRLWQRRFGGDREIIGKTLPAEGAGLTIVGVMPSNFRPLV